MFKKAVTTRWKIIKAQFARIFGDERSKRIAESELRSLKRIKRLEDFSLKPKTKQDLEKAKEIFFENNCHQTTMIREGVYEEFKKYGGNYELQQRWRKEFISYWVGKLSTEDLKPVDRLHFAWGEEALPELIEMSHKGDGYSRLWYANAIWDLTKSETVSEDTRKKGEETAIRIWEDLVNNPIENLSEGHKKTITPALFALGASTPEEYVVNYAKSQLQKNNLVRD